MAHARADEHRGPVRHSAVDEEAPVLGQADRGDSMPLISTARSTGRNEALRTSMRFLTTWLTSAKSVARTTQAAMRSSPVRLPATSTQFPVASGSRE